MSVEPRTRFERTTGAAARIAIFRERQSAQVVKGLLPAADHPEAPSTVQALLRVFGRGAAVFMWPFFGAAEIELKRQPSLLFAASGLDIQADLKMDACIILRKSSTKVEMKPQGEQKTKL